MALPIHKSALRAARASAPSLPRCRHRCISKPHHRPISTSLAGRQLDDGDDEMMPLDPDSEIPAPLGPRKPTASSRKPPPPSRWPFIQPSSASSFDASTANTPIPSTLEDNRPRWSYTPERMKAPFNPNVPKDPRRSVWTVNNDPRVLDEMYTRLLGRDGPRMLQDEVKWLAVTHKSFDQGRRGFNDKLAYFGRMSIMMECAQWITSSAPKRGALVQDRHGREPFAHRSLEMLDNLNAMQPLNIVTRDRVQRLAMEVGLDKVLRWKPKTPENLDGAGLTLVLNGALHAIAGAVWLQHGAEMGGRVVRDKILRRLAS